MWVCLIVDEFKVLKLEIENILYLRIDFHLRQRKGFARQLKFYLLQMVVVDVSIPEGVDKISWLESGDLRNHQCQKGIGGDVKWYPKEDICTALVELAGEFPVVHIKLEKQMAGWEFHFIQIPNIPGVDDQSARQGIVFNLFDNL